MSAIAETSRGIAFYPAGGLNAAGGLARRFLASIFHWSKPTGLDPERDVENQFQDYLDGYFNSFDYYPVCTRHVFAKNDAYALWSDFMKIAADTSRSSEALVLSPERFLKLGAISSDELKKRKSKAAEESIRRAIEEAKPR